MFDVSVVRFVQYFRCTVNLLIQFVRQDLRQIRRFDGPGIDVFQIVRIRQAPDGTLGGTQRFASGQIALLYSGIRCQGVQLFIGISCMETVFQNIPQPGRVFPGIIGGVVRTGCTILVQCIFQVGSYIGCTIFCVCNQVAAVNPEGFTVTSPSSFRLNSAGAIPLCLVSV